MGNKKICKAIFQDHWDIYRALHSSKLRKVEIKEVNKMLECRDEKRGFIEYYCNYCQEYRTIHFGCNRGICSRCDKSHSDKWQIRYYPMCFIRKSKLVQLLFNTQRDYLHRYVYQ